MARFTGNSGSLCYGDGENLIMQWGDDAVTINHPLISSLTVEHNATVYDDCCGRRVNVPGLLSLEMTLVSSGPFSFAKNSRVPDLRAIAEKLTVAELFSVIEKKLAKRGESLNKGVVLA